MARSAIATKNDRMQRHSNVSDRTGIRKNAEDALQASSTQIPAFGQDSIGVAIRSPSQRGLVFFSVTEAENLSAKAMVVFSAFRFSVRPNDILEN